MHPVKQQFVELGLVLQEGMQVADYKIIVFFTTARLTQLASEIFNKIAGFDVMEIHSRKSQSHRTKVSARFREGRSVIMFTSDVTARGMDYPDVSKVVQVGLPSDKAQYIHRLGRTARAGKGGNGVLLLVQDEARYFMPQLLKDQPIKQGAGATAADMSKYGPVIERAIRATEDKTISMACVSAFLFLSFVLFVDIIDLDRLCDSRTHTL